MGKFMHANKGLGKSPVEPGQGRLKTLAQVAAKGLFQRAKQDELVLIISTGT